MVRGGGGLTAPYIAQAAKEIEEALKDLQARGVVELPENSVAILRMCSIKTKAQCSVLSISINTSIDSGRKNFVGGASMRV